MTPQSNFGPIPLSGITSKMSTYVSMVLLLMLTWQTGLVVSQPIVIHRGRAPNVLYQGRAESSRIWDGCESDTNTYCFGTKLNGSNLVKSTKGDGCIKRNDCSFLMVIKNDPSNSQVYWRAYQLSDPKTDQTSGRFQAAFRQKKPNTFTNCKPTRGSTEPSWPPETFILEGDKLTASQKMDNQDSSKVFEPKTPITIYDSGSGRNYGKFEWTSGTDPSLGSTKLSTSDATAYAVKVWSDKGTSWTYEGCIDFVHPVKFFDVKSVPGIEDDPNRPDNDRNTDSDGSLLWLWILLGLLLLLLILALLIWLCCCRKKEPTRPASTVQEPSAAGQPAPGSAAPGSGVPSAKPSSAMAPQSSAKPPGSATPGAASERSMRSAMTTVPTGKSVAPSNASMRSKWSGASSNAPSGASQMPTSKTPSKTGSKSKVGSSSPSKSPSSTGSSKSSSLKNLY